MGGYQVKVDNFALTLFQSCPIKYKLRMLDGWTTRRKSAALGFGGAIHEGLAEWYRTGDRVAAVRAIDAAWPSNSPIDDYRSKEKCLTVMLEYIKQYPQESFQVVGAPTNPMVECTFTLDTGMYLSCINCGPIAGKWDGEYKANGSDVILLDPGSDCPQCQASLEPLEYGGIFDGLVDFSNNIYVLEHKSTSQLGSYYFNQFKPNNQVTGYVWGAGKLSGQRVGGAIINAIGVYKSGTTKFERQITTRSAHDIAEWLNNLQKSCELIRACERAQYWPMFTGSCTMYGACEYHSVHVLGSPTEREKLLEQDYVREEWVYEQRAGVKDE
jgi:hypothetical protein